jgi:hypothetical protein
MRRKQHSNRFKRLRAAMRVFEADPRERAYDVTRMRRRAEPVGFAADENGVPQPVFFRYVTYTLVLKHLCGRWWYQQSKGAA